MKMIIWIIFLISVTSSNICIAKSRTRFADSTIFKIYSRTKDNENEELLSEFRRNGISNRTLYHTGPTGFLIDNKKLCNKYDAISIEVNNVDENHKKYIPNDAVSFIKNKHKISSFFGRSNFVLNKYVPIYKLDTVQHKDFTKDNFTLINHLEQAKDQPICVNDSKFEQVILVCNNKRLKLIVISPSLVSKGFESNMTSLGNELVMKLKTILQIFHA